MPSRRPLPPELGRVFSVRAALDAGVTPGRLRDGGLDRPFHGVRSRPFPAPGAPQATEPSAYDVQAQALRAAARAYAPRMLPRQFISHRSAAAMWHAPMPLLRVDDDEGKIVGAADMPLDVSTFGDGHLPRLKGVKAHRARARTSRVVQLDGVQVSDAATTWASLGGTLSLIDTVALGDFFCREWTPGAGRPNVGMRPIATVDDLQRATDAGRRVGVRRLREALSLIRTGSWSPRESAVRCHIVFAGLPEPELNVDVFTAEGHFLGCVDLAYPELKIAIEYQSVLHASRYSQDVERIAALRAAGWEVIEVTATLLADPDAMVARIRRAIARRRATL